MGRGLNLTISKQKKSIGSIRRTQLVTTFGSGSIADMPGKSVIIGSIDNWNMKNCKTLNEPNLEKLLGVSCFKEPAVIDDSKSDEEGKIPAYRFPVWHFCPQCHRLMPYENFDSVNGTTCRKCGKAIIPSRFVAACANGHLEDFPYFWWVHGSDCKTGCSDKDLVVIFSDKSGGLESIIIKCTRCNKSRSMKNCMNKDALDGYPCHGHRPWMGKNNNDPNPCRAPMRTLQRGASNVYFSLTASALTLPPWKDELRSEIKKYWDTLSILMENSIDGYKPFVDDEILTKVIAKKFKNFIEKYGSSDTSKAELLNEIVREVKNYGKQIDQVGYTMKDLREEEYQRLRFGDYDEETDIQYNAKRVDVPQYLKGFIKDVVMVKRLREILALKGFRRIYPDKPSPNDPKFKGVHYDYIPLGDSHTDWLPAIELLGEGIFITLDDKRLNKWELKHKDYYRAMGNQLANSNVECENFSPRYVLLHTLAHLLIRQLSIECGYSGASIKERIYSTYLDSDTTMAGILLYTSSSDSDGSLGGLVRNAMPDSLENIFRNMLQEASWCSSDPVCADSKAQGYDSLNYAACHACTLLPETSCEMRNCLLDRVSVVGTVENRELGYFGDLFQETYK